MIDIETYATQQRIISTFGDTVERHLGFFFNAYGKTAYVDMMTLLDLVTKPTGYSNVGTD